jgi:hypothetical protein
MRVPITVVLAATLTIPAVASAQARQAARPKLQGAWRVVEFNLGQPNSTTVKTPQPGMYVFTAKHYALARENAPRKAPVNPQAPTVQELRNTLDFAAQSGTWELNAAGELVVRRVAALGISAMAPGNFAVFEVKAEGDSVITLTTKANQSGPVTTGAYTKLRRVE